MFKLLIKKSKKTVFEGYEALKIPVGTIIKVLPTSVANANDYIIKLPDNEKPFRTLFRYDMRFGNYEKPVEHLWGNAIGSYRFKIIAFQNEDELEELINQKIYPS